MIVAINKMDLVDYSEARFNEIRDAYVALAKQLGLNDVRFVPVSALKGDNIVGASERMPWYAGEPLLDVLESLPVETQAHDALRFPVQWVARQDGSSADDFRGYMGRIESGEVKVGDEIVVLPSNRTATIAEIVAPVPGGTASVPHAFAGQTVTIRLAEDVDVSRGDMFVTSGEPVEPAKKLEADLCWFDETPLPPQRKYLLKQTTSTVFAKIGGVKQVLDVHAVARDRPSRSEDERHRPRRADAAEADRVRHVRRASGYRCVRADRRGDASHGRRRDDPGVLGMTGQPRRFAAARAGADARWKAKRQTWARCI